MSAQLEELVAKARAVAEIWAQLERNTVVVTTGSLTQALDGLVEAVAHWVAATNPTERVEPLPELMTVRITGGPLLGLTGVVVMRHTLAAYEVEVFDGAGASLGTSAIARQHLEPLLEP